MDNTYGIFVKELAEKKISKDFLNHDQEHALEVFESLFNGAEKEVRIFAASLCEENSPTYVANSERYIIALSDFIEKNGELYILLNRYNKEKAAKSKLMRRLAYYLSVENYKHHIHLKTTPSKFHFVEDKEENEIHFTVIDEVAYRIEFNVEKRAAVCNFNNPVVARDLVAQFDEVFGSSNSMDIADMFNS